jgi:hypothetical protein
MDRYYRWSAWPIVSIDIMGIDPSIHRLLCPPMIAGHKIIKALKHSRAINRPLTL